MIHLKMDADRRSDSNSNNGGDHDQYFQALVPYSPDVREIRPLTPTPVSDASKIGAFPNAVRFYQKPRKKRSKLSKMDENSGGVSKPKTPRKPSSDAPKITMPCTECGRRFWSWKALFGHMRCHPERQWRGIIPPSNFQNQASSSGTKPGPDSVTVSVSGSGSVSGEDYDAAASLILLSNGAAMDSDSVFIGSCVAGLNCTRFECSSCKKVFGSHQALGGHRASHKNVKGCFAINKSEGGPEEGTLALEGTPVVEDTRVMELGHKCSVCLRVFSSGQALGGHKRCHFEKYDEVSGMKTMDLDLNLPPVESDDRASSSCSVFSSSAMALDLRLGI